jgi:hypothetical protein
MSFLMVNLAMVMQDLTGSQVMSAYRAFSASIRPLFPFEKPHPLCVTTLLMIVSAVLSVATLFHSALALLSSSSSSPLHHPGSKSLATWVVLPVSYIVLMFQVATLVLSVRRGISFEAPFRLSLHCVMSLQDGGSSSPRWMSWFVVANASVTITLARRKPLSSRGWGWKFNFRITSLLEGLHMY